MTKTLNDFLEVYKPKSPDEQKFVDKHVTIKYKDRNGNGDDVFNGNTKTIKRKEERHGYDVGEDEKVYEEKLKGNQHKIDANKNGKIDAHDFQLLRSRKKVTKVTNEEADDSKEMPFERPYKKTGEHKDQYGNKVKNVARHLAHKAMNTMKSKLAKEEFADDITEDTAGDVVRANHRIMQHQQYIKNIMSADMGNPFQKVIQLRDAKKHLASLHADRQNAMAKHEEEMKKSKVKTRKKKVSEEVILDDLLDTALDILNSIDEKTLTSAEIKKREEVVKAIKRDDPKMDRSMAYAIATKTAKRVAEGTMPTADEPTDANKRTAQKVRDLLAREKKPVKKDSKEMNEEEDDGWYTHNEMHGKVSKEKWKKGWRYSPLKGKPFYHRPTKTWHASIKEDTLDEEINWKAYDVVTKGHDGKTYTQIFDAHGSSIHQKIRDVRKERDNQPGTTKYARFMHDRLLGAYGAWYKQKKEAMKEESEQIDELSKKTLVSYANKAAFKIGDQGITAGLKIQNNEPADKNFKTMGKRQKGIAAAVGKLAKEEVEAIDELSKKTLGSYISRATNQAFGKGYTGGSMKARGIITRDSEEENAGEKNIRKGVKRIDGVNKAVRKLTREDIINRTIEKYVPEDMKFTPEERLLKRIDGLSEGHIDTLLGLFEALNSDNQNKMIETVESHEGINQLLNFALENKGE